MPLRNGRRADLMGVDAKGRIVIVEIKVSRADLVGDGKWPDYLDFCDRFYWGLAAHLDRACMETEAFRPERCGLIVADGFGGEMLREPLRSPLAPPRRKAVTLAFAQLVSARLMAINHLAMMKAVLGDLDRVKRIVKMIGYVSCAPGFTEPHLVLNGVSDLFVALWGEENGKHARAALTQHELGLNAPIEADITVELHG